MIIHLKFKSLITVALLSAFSGFAVAATEKSVGENNDLAPEATAAEATLTFRDIPDLKEAFIDATPTDRKDGIQVGELGINGVNKAMILKLAQEIADKNYVPYDSLLISHKGKLVFESYYRRGRVDLPQYNSTKAYLSMAIGRAIQLGYLTMEDLDQPVINFLKELDPTKFVKGVEKITLHQALTLQSGIRIDPEKEQKWQKSSEQMRGQKQVQKYLELSDPITTESQVFKYSHLGPQLMMQVLDTIVPGTAKEFIRNEVLSKIGITNYSWDDDVSGLPKSMYGAKFTPRDMLKWGMLVRNKGKWKGEQLIAEAYITKATNRIVSIEDESHESFASKNGTNTGYGYFWWQIDMKVGNTNYFCTSATGGGGPYIMVIEELDLIVVATGHGGKVKPYQLTAERILPAFIQNSTATMSGKSDSQDKFPVLKSPYLGQKPPGSIPEAFAPGIVTTKNWEAGGFFTPDMKAFYLNRSGGKYKKNSLVVFQNENNQWHESFVSPRVGRPLIAPNGKTMHLGSKYMERTKDGWSEVKSLGPMFDREDWGIMRLSASANGTYVFDDYKSNDVIRISTIKNGKREEPKLLGKEINTGKWTAHPFIAPDESYLIWDSERDSGYGDSDLYISYRQEDNTWGEAINLGDKINTNTWEGGAYVTPDGKYLFFNKSIGPEDVDIYWVDAQIIETLRPK